MKKNLSILATLALAMAMSPAAFSQDNSSQSPSSPAPTQSSPSQDTTQTPPSQSPSTAAQDTTSPSQNQSPVTGTVVKAGDKYVLKTDTMTYQLDDQDMAQKYEGREVKVNGTVDSTTSIIHVNDLTPVTPQ
jgi:glucan-binding YG repeat protein